MKKGIGLTIDVKMWKMTYVDRGVFPNPKVRRSVSSSAVAAVGENRSLAFAPGIDQATLGLTDAWASANSDSLTLEASPRHARSRLDEPA